MVKNDYININDASKKWGLSSRQVQHLCSIGSVEGAVKFGRDWMIPKDAHKPQDKRTKKQNLGINNNMSLLREAPFLDMTDMYTVPGSVDSVIDSLIDCPVAKELFEAEIAYSRGEIDRVIEKAKYFLSLRSEFYTVNAGGMLLGLVAMWRGDISLYRKAKLHIFEAPAKTQTDKEIMGLSIACVDSAVRDISSYPDWFTRGQFGHLPVDSHPAARVFYAKYLLVRAQDLAKSQMQLPDVSGLGLLKTIPYIFEPLISQTMVEKTIIPEIYLRLLVAIAYHQTGEDKRAIPHIDKAIELALPDRLFGILAEHRRQFDSLLDDRLAIADPQACKKVKELHRGLIEGWTKLHNSLLSRSVENSFTIREREVARLAAFGLSNSEIANQLHITVSMVKKVIYDAMNKSGCNKRKELGAYV